MTEVFQGAIHGMGGRPDRHAGDFSAAISALNKEYAADKAEMQEVARDVREASIKEGERDVVAQKGIASKIQLKKREDPADRVKKNMGKKGEAEEEKRLQQIDHDADEFSGDTKGETPAEKLKAVRKKLIGKKTKQEVKKAIDEETADVKPGVKDDIFEFLERTTTAEQKKIVKELRQEHYQANKKQIDYHTELSTIARQLTAEKDLGDVTSIRGQLSLLMEESVSAQDLVEKVAGLYKSEVGIVKHLGLLFNMAGEEIKNSKINRPHLTTLAKTVKKMQAAKACLVLFQNDLTRIEKEIRMTQEIG